MKWVITKPQNNKQYYLQRATISGQNTWTCKVDTAIHYDTELAADYVIALTGIQNASTQQIKLI